MAKTSKLLPGIFQTETNKQFLDATLDQLTQEPEVKRTQGYIGRKIGPGVDPANPYVIEPTKSRTDYQLEPSVVFLKPETETAIDAITYPGIIDSLNNKGADTTRQDRLVSSEFYSWDPFCDLDKFTNYSQYYWLPQGPESVDIQSLEPSILDQYTITRNNANNSYTFSTIKGVNPTITLVRGGEYEFTVNQTGNPFWIQLEPGVSGTMPSTPNISSRDVLGVINNGDDNGVVKFLVPEKTAQNFYYTLNEIEPVGLVTDLRFDSINNVYVDQFLDQYPTGIDGITSLDKLTVVFKPTVFDPVDSGWQILSQFDNLEQDPANNGKPGSFDTLTFDQATPITLDEQRYSIWRIDYVTDDDGRQFMQLNSIRNVPNLTKFEILYGVEGSNTTWYKNAQGYYEQQPLLTAVSDVLWYQDQNNPEIFGQIKLVEQNQTPSIDIEDIIGATNYTSPNGVVLTNGLKIKFQSPTVPAMYTGNEYFVEGVGTGPGKLHQVGWVDGEAYYGPSHVHLGRLMTGAVHNSEEHQYIYPTLAESLANVGISDENLTTSRQRELPSSDYSGNGIRLIPVDELVTPEKYTESEFIPYDSIGYDEKGYDTSLNAPVDPDYITINRSSHDRNPWSRSNRWFHIDVINYSAELNSNVIEIDNLSRAKRPIIEFRGNLKLFNFGTQSKDPVNVIDLNQTDALSNVNGQVSYGVDGYTFLPGTRVIFAADTDPEVRNRVYQVNFIDPDDTGTDIIDLVPVVNGEALANQTVVCLNGATLQGKSFYFVNGEWIQGQQKTQINQPPLFDVFDSNGYSFGDTSQYPGTTFAGNKLFAYKDAGTTLLDPVLGLSLSYLNIDNIGDILFENSLNTETFIWVKTNTSITQAVNSGFVHQYVNRVSFKDAIGWQVAAQKNSSRQTFSFTYKAATPIEIDIPVNENTQFAPVHMYVNGEFVLPNSYTYTITNGKTKFSFATAPVEGSKVELSVFSNTASATGFYEIPSSLQSNPLNQNSAQFTLGSIRNHYESVAQNLVKLTGKVNGSNNSRDLGNILPYGTKIVQQSSPATLSGVFLRRPEYEIFDSLHFNSREYEKYKSLLLDCATKGDFVNKTVTEILDDCIAQIALNKNENSAFYWSDMIPSSETYTKTVYTYSLISTNTFDTVNTYDFSTSNYQGLLVYLNNNLLTMGTDYTVGTATVTLTGTLAIGDTIELREYNSTYGNFVPNTPSKMGLYPKYRPQIFVDTSYTTPTTVIQGHDGSITVAFGDFRDQLLLEFETRIYNNIKTDGLVPISLEDVMPGQFRDTDYSLDEINQTLLPMFIDWIGWNKLEYTNQYYDSQNSFTYNYKGSSNALTREPLLGNWRANYLYFYDTITPHLTPWEMLGLSEKPSWWEMEYGPAPYTSGNKVLWGDLEAGRIKDPVNPRTDSRYARPGLLSVIPVTSEGALADPFQCVVGNYDKSSFVRRYNFGDVGPVENVWRSSSSYPFAVMKLLALTKPFEFFSLFADRDLYRYDTLLEQYLWDKRYRIDAQKLTPLYGNGTSKASYINWIIDYNRLTGRDSTQNLATLLTYVDVRLAWRLASYSDKDYLKVFTERSTPQGNNNSLLLPDESYSLMLYKNVPSQITTYSSVVVQRTENGWTVSGYGKEKNYFEILRSRVAGPTKQIVAGDAVETIPSTYTNNIVRIAYGHEFRSRNSVCDFLVSYGELLERRGFVFENKENGFIMNWTQMASEFLYYSEQGWAPGTVINLNPTAQNISVSQPNLVVDNITPTTNRNSIVNQNNQTISVKDLDIYREGNSIQIRSLTKDTINYLNLSFTAYEHIMILDNVSVFNDLMYDPVTGSRQNRIKISGWTSANWNGTVDAPGFVLNENNIEEWVESRKYTKGEIVLYKGNYYVAKQIVQPNATFEYNKWLESDYSEIKTGLLPNSAYSSNQLATSYSVYDANLEQEVDLFSYGLIGFRPRQYMQALNLDDVSQVNLYRQFLGTKGTVQSAELFSQADLGKEISEYDIYDYWEVLKSTYGANANRRYIEVLLDEAELPSNPSIVQVTNPEQISDADQTVLYSQLWKSSYKLNSNAIFPTTREFNLDNQLPIAGYVSEDDVDIQVFDLEQQGSLNSDLATVQIGTSIWSAKINDFDWGVFRTTAVVGTVIQVSDDLNGFVTVVFNREHNLSVGDNIIIKDFNALVNGSYTVPRVTGLKTIQLPGSFSDTTPSDTISGSGICVKIQSARVSQPSAIADLSFAKQLRPGIKIWSDTNAAGNWSVLEKTDPFTKDQNLTTDTPYEFTRFGTRISQGLYNQSALVGAPDYNPQGVVSAPGATYVFLKNDNDSYVQRVLLQLDATDAAGFGNSLDVGLESWAVIGASASRNNSGYAATVYIDPVSTNVDVRQLLVSPDQNFGAGEFGYDVTLSQNEHWAFMSSPAHNRVHVFQQRNVQTQRVDYTADGVETSFNWSNHIVADYTKPYQIVVVVNNVVMTPVTDYAINSADIVFVTAPEENAEIRISRRSSVQLDSKVSYNVSGTNVSGSGSGALFTVNNVRGEYTVATTAAGENYSVGDVISIDQDTIATADSPAPTPISTTYVSDAGSTVTVSSTSGIVEGMTVSGTGFTSGQYVVSVGGPTTVTLNAAPDTTPSGSLVFSHNALIVVQSVGGSGEIVTVSVNGSGVSDTVIFDLEKYLKTVKDIYSFRVKIGDTIQRPHLDYDYNSDSSLLANDLVLNTTPPKGSEILVDANSSYGYVTTLEPSVAAGAKFGFSVSADTKGTALIVGAPGTNDSVGESYFYSRTIQRFIAQTNGTVTFSVTPSVSGNGEVDLTVNGTYQLNKDLNIGGTFSVNTVSNTVTVDNLIIGDIVEVETNQMVLTETITGSNLSKEAQFGYKVDHCVNNCSLYIGAPYDNEDAYNRDVGRVEFWLNQSRMYGSITSTVCNPVLSTGDKIRINNYYVECTGTTVAQLAADINAAALPNVVATTTADLTFTGDDKTNTFAIGTLYSSASSYNTVVLVDGVTQTENVDYTYNNATQQIVFVAPPIIGAVITVRSGQLTVSVSDQAAANNLDRVNVLPATGTLFEDLGFDVYRRTQIIKPPVVVPFAHFGEEIHISNDTNTLFVGAPNGSTFLDTTFDNGNTYFDFKSTNIVDEIEQSGAAYSYDLLVPYNETAINPSQLVFGQQFKPAGLQPYDEFGKSIDFTSNTLLIGSPGADLGDSTTANFGVVLQWQNPGSKPAWQTIRQQQPVVDIARLNSSFIYDRTTGQTEVFFDYFDPLQGKMLGVVQENLDFTGAVDPAFYNEGTVNNNGMKWGEEQVGKIWWNTSNARFIDPNQNDITYASRKWGALFPGSSVDVYQWIESTVPPEQYTTPGIPLSTVSYVSKTKLDEQGFLVQVYYFWVTGLLETNVSAGKTLSTTTIARYIENPRGSGIPYIALLNNSTFSMYNVLDYIRAQDSVIDIEFDQTANDNAVHVENELVAEGKPDAFLSPRAYRKLLDSFTGTDPEGRLVPDPMLPQSELYGIAYRPRQSMFVDRFTALKNYILSANATLAKYPISETKSFNLLNSKEPIPSAASGEWNKKVATYTELTYQNLALVPIGYKYLVENDSTNNNLWTIYQVTVNTSNSDRQLTLIRVQNYDTTKYWNYIDWYDPTFNKFLRVVDEVPVAGELLALNLPADSVVKVLANSRNKWELHQYNGTEWVRVALEDGTIAVDASVYDYSISRFGFDSEVFDALYYDQAPNIETRKIIEALNQEIFTNDLLIERNRLLMVVFQYVLSEQPTVDWLRKSSLIDVDHVVRNLEPYQQYRVDNQDFVLNYIQEVKPYHTQIKNFNLKYNGLDIADWDLTDFDLPAEWDTQKQMFISPILDNTQQMSTTSSYVSSADIWKTFPYNQWFNNYSLSIESVSIVNGGSGYTVAPDIQVIGEATRAAVMTARINSAGQVISINVVDPGEGYLDTATITVTGGNGTGATAVAVMGNQKVRSVTTTLRYDRLWYTSSVVEWQANTAYAAGTLVRYNNQVWIADDAVVAASSFNPDFYTLKPAGDLSGLDRTQGYYVPTENESGLDLAQLINGLEYPGVQVSAPGFEQNTGFDVGNFDNTPFDNLSVDATGAPSYDQGILDAIYESSFTDSYLGLRATDINVEGGGFVDTYSSHAPEELVPGITFDTLDFKVFTTPGADWTETGEFGFPLAEKNFEFVDSTTAVSFAGVLSTPVQLMLFNVTKGIGLSEGHDYTINWAAQTVTALSPTNSVNDVIKIQVYGIGGGNQMLTQTYPGEDIGDSLLIDIDYDSIEEIAVFSNGIQVTAFTYLEHSTSQTEIDFNTAFTANDLVTVVVFGTPISTGESWSTALTQTFVSAGELDYTLSNSMQGTNPLNVIVEKNGIRARPYEGARYTGDGATTAFSLPQNADYDLDLVSNNDVSVFVDNVALVYGVDFTLQVQTVFDNGADFGLVTESVSTSEDIGLVTDPATGSEDLGLVTEATGKTRNVILTTAPATGATVLIGVRTKAQYWVMGNTLVFQPAQGLIPTVGDIITVTSWNDTSEQDLYTQLFVGPNSTGIVSRENYDTVPFDSASADFSSGAYDYQAGTTVDNNIFDTGQAITDTRRLFVTQNGKYLNPEEDFVVSGSTVEILGPIIGPADEIAITTFAQNVADPTPLAFRIFKDMRNTETTYRITANTTTVLTKALGISDDVIYVKDAGHLPQPDLTNGTFGLITINGERITYRERNTVNNTVSGLRRGTAGTGADTHAVSSKVYSIGSGNILDSEYQDQYNRENFLGDGSTVTFTTESITISSVSIDDAIIVKLGGTTVASTEYTVDSINPVAITFNTAPSEGYQVTIEVEQAKSWYAPGSTTASNGVPLQKQTTTAGRFFQGF